MSLNGQQSPVRRLTEGGICIALSLALSYLKIPVMAGFGGFGGSIDFVMIPLIIFAVRWGLGWGIGAGFVFGTLQIQIVSFEAGQLFCPGAECDCSLYCFGVYAANASQCSAYSGIP